MPGFGDIFGNFMTGYRDTVLQRHKQREEQFHDLMEMHQHYQKIADDLEQKKPVWKKGVHDVMYNEAVQGAQKAAMEAEKALNEKIGGLHKIGSLLMGKKGKGGAQGQLPGQEQPSEVPQAAEGSPAPGSAGGWDAQAAARPLIQPPVEQGKSDRFADVAPRQAGAGTGLAPMGTETPFAATAPAPTLAGVQASPQATAAAVYMNPFMAEEQRQAELRAKRLRQDELDFEIQKAEKIGDIATRNALKLEKQKHEQQDIWDKEDEEWLKSLPIIEKLRPEQQAELFASIRLRRNVNLSDMRAPQWNVGEENINGVLYDVARDASGAIVGRRPTGLTAGARTLDAKRKQAIEDLMKVRKNQGFDITEKDAELELLTNEFEAAQDKAKLRGLNVLNRQAMYAYRDVQAKNAQELRDLAKVGRNMTPQQAAMALRHADAEAQFVSSWLGTNQIQAPTTMTDPTEKADFVAAELIRRSDEIIRRSLNGMTRAELVEIATGKRAPTIEERGSNVLRKIGTPPPPATRPGATEGKPWQAP